MNLIETKVKDLYIIEPTVHGDKRGWFLESWSKRTLEEAGLYYDFIQDNHSYSAQKGTLRGLHCQKGDAAQAKLVRCIRGAVLDVAVDMRKGSPTYMKWEAVELSEKNFRQLLIPRGFLHGFLTLTDNVEFVYKVDNYYNKDAEIGIHWNDPDLNIDWGINEPILSDKDKIAPFLKDCNIDFYY